MMNSNKKVAEHGERMYELGKKRIMVTDLKSAKEEIERLQSDLDTLRAENKVITDSFDSMGRCIASQASALMAAEKLALEFDTLKARMKELEKEVKIAYELGRSTTGGER